MSTCRNSNPLIRFDSSESRDRLARADVVVAVDPDQKTHTVLYGREMLEQIRASGARRKAVVVTFNLDTATKELEELNQLVCEVKGCSSYRPADLFPEVDVDEASFVSEIELLALVRQAVKVIVEQHRTLLPSVPLRFHYSIAAVGFATADEELRSLAEEVGKPIAYLSSLMAFGDLLQSKVPPELIKPHRCLDVEHGVGESGNRLTVRCRSLNVRSTSQGPVYHARRMPKIRFKADGRERLVVFTRHALESVCERTVYNWKTYGGQGDAFAFLDNCIYFEDCSDARGEPSLAIYNACMPNFHSWDYLEGVLGPQSSDDVATEGTGGQFYYRVGYCPIRLDGDLAIAATLLFPGMNKQMGTPEGRLIDRAGLSPDEIAAMRNRVENQLSMKALADSSDFSLVKWFHDNGVPQVVRLTNEVFQYD